MSKKLARKGIALASGISLAAFGLVAQPAVAAAGDVTLSPTTGTSFTVFNTDDMNITTSVSAFLQSTDTALSYQISNPDQFDLLIDFNTTDATSEIDLTGVKADGSTVAITNIAAGTDIAVDGAADGISLATDGDKSGSIGIDFDAQDLVALRITAMDEFIDDAKTFSITALASTALAASNVLTNLQATTARAASLGYGNDDASITVQAWLESSAATVVDAAYASAAQTVTFVDPANVSVISKVERVVGNHYSEAGNGAVDSRNINAQDHIAGSLRFSNTSINLDQVDLTQWKYALTSSVAAGADDIAITAIALGAEAAGGNEINLVTPAGYKSTNRSAYGRLVFKAAVGGDSLAKGETYKFTFRHGDDTTPFSDYTSAAFEVPDFTSTAVEIDATVADTVNAKVGSYAAGAFPVTVRNGTSEVKFSANVETAADVDVETPNIPVFAKVTAGANFPSGATLSITGTTDKIVTASSAVYTAGLTDSDGAWSVTVTSSDTSAAGSTYSIEFFVLKTDGSLGTTYDGANATKLTADYAAASYSTFTADSSVLSGASPSVTFSVADVFGQAISATSTGKAYSVELKASDKDNLEEYAAVVGGEATFTIDNWLTDGSSDVLTAKLFTGSSSSPSYVSGASTTVTLYKTNDTYAVNVPTKIADLLIPYVDFITGKSTTAAPGPTGGTTYTGTVVDSNGAGIPGAPVTISGENMQFKSGTTFYKDSVTLNADAAGGFTVEFWTQTASAAGKNITVTSGGKTATTLVTSKVPDGNGNLSAANLRFSWTTPAQPVMNTTYAVVATVTDVWGNPIKNAEVKFSGFAAAEFNAAASATKTTGADGTATAYLRSIKDVDGLAAINAQLTKVNQDAGADEDVDDLATTFITNVATTSWDETAWNDELDAEINFLKSAADAPAASADQKVNAGSFKGYVALYAKGYAGKRMSAKVGKDWVVVPVLASNFERVVEYTGAGYTVAVRIYIDRVLIDTITVTTK